MLIKLLVILYFVEKLNIFYLLNNFFLFVKVSVQKLIVFVILCKFYLIYKRSDCRNKSFLQFLFFIFIISCVFILHFLFFHFYISCSFIFIYSVLSFLHFLFINFYISCSFICKFSIKYVVSRNKSFNIAVVNFILEVRLKVFCQQK